MQQEEEEHENGPRQRLLDCVPCNYGATPECLTDGRRRRTASTQALMLATQDKSHGTGRKHKGTS